MLTITVSCAQTFNYSLIYIAHVMNTALQIANI